MFLALTSGNTPQSLSLATIKSEVAAATDGQEEEPPFLFCGERKSGFFLLQHFLSPSDPDTGSLCCSLSEIA